MIEKTFPITEKLLDKGLDLSKKLYDLLSQEEGVLKQRSPAEHLSVIARHKKETIFRLEQFSEQLAQVLSSENLSLPQEGMERYLRQARAKGLQTENAQLQWEQILDTGKKCRDLNEQNGAAIDLLTRHNERLLRILRGQSQTTTTYGPDGATRDARFSQTYVSV